VTYTTKHEFIGYTPSLPSNYNDLAAKAKIGVNALQAVYSIYSVYLTIFKNTKD
jgi:hypothetical protein